MSWARFPESGSAWSHCVLGEKSDRKAVHPAAERSLPPHPFRADIAPSERDERCGVGMVVAADADIHVVINTWDKWKASPDSEWMKNSGDYHRVVDIVDAFQGGGITSEQMVLQVRALELAPHPLGCGYLGMPVPMPPPGSDSHFDERIMPLDWEGTIGEVHMVRGLLGDDWEAFHEALHPSAGDCAPIRAVTDMPSTSPQPTPTQEPPMTQGENMPVKTTTLPTEKPAVPLPDADRVTQYLRKGRVVLRMAGQVKDVLADDGSDVPGSHGFVTDGEWVWTTGMSHYVTTYGVSPGKELLAKIRAADYICAEVDDATLAEVSQSFRKSLQLEQASASQRQAAGVASTLLGNELPMKEEYWVEGDAYHFWQPVRGGAGVIVAKDGSYLFGLSSVPPQRLKEEFLAGRRTPDTVLKTVTLIDEAFKAIAERDFDAFDDVMGLLYELPWEETYPLAQARFRGILNEVFGASPTYDQLIKVSKGVHLELAKHVEVSPYTVESIVRSYYGDAEMTKDLPGEAAMMLELAIAGVILSGPSD